MEIKTEVEDQSLESESKIELKYDSKGQDSLGALYGSLKEMWETELKDESGKKWYKKAG